MKRNILFLIYSIVTILILFMGYNLIYKDKTRMDRFSKITLDSKLRQTMIKKNIWSNNCPVPLDRLSLLRLSYVDFEGTEHHNGKMIVLDVVADHVLAIFKELFDNKFPIASINLINDYEGNDELSMENNNSSAFNCRNIANGNVSSIHSYGLAIDVNPQQNPYLITKYEEMSKGSIPVFPALGIAYVNRRNIRTGMVESVVNNNTKETVVDVFSKHGFKIWGGNWNDPIDWHHFQLTREQSDILIKMNYSDGLKFFNQLTSAPAYGEKAQENH